MYLDQKAQKKIKILTTAYIVIFLFALGAGCLLLSYELIILSIIAGVLTILIRKLGKYSEGSAKLINLGNKKIQTELKPREFIDEINRLENDDNVIKGKDDHDILNLLNLAYSSIGEEEKCLEIIERGISSAKPGSQKTISWQIIRMISLYEQKKLEDADLLLSKIESKKLNFLNKANLESAKSLAIPLAKNDMAKAEDYCRKRLLPHKGILKESNLSLASLHLILGEICIKTDREKEGYMHLNYAIENGGETIYPSYAKEIIEKYEQSKISAEPDETDEKPE